MENEIKFDEIVFDHSRDTVAEAMGIDIADAFIIYRNEVTPVIERLTSEDGIAQKSIIIEGIHKADIPLKYKIFLWHQLDNFLVRVHSPHATT